MQPTKRNLFFDGKLLNTEELSREQDYHRDSHDPPSEPAEDGSGIMTGITVSASSDAEVHISAGSAVDSTGHCISVPPEHPDQSNRTPRKKPLRNIP